MVYFRNGYMPQNYQSEEVASSLPFLLVLPLLLVLVEDSRGVLTGLIPFCPRRLGKLVF